MEDKTTKTRISGKIGYIYDNKDPKKAKWINHVALNDEGQSVGTVHLEHNGANTPQNNLCAMSKNGKYGYPTFARLKPAIEVFNTDKKSVGFRFEYL